MSGLRKGRGGLAGGDGGGVSLSPKTGVHPGATFLLLLVAEPPLEEDDEDKDLEQGTVPSPKPSIQSSTQSDIDITAEFLQPLLTPDNVANLVGILGV